MKPTQKVYVVSAGLFSPTLGNGPELLEICATREVAEALLQATKDRAAEAHATVVNPEIEERDVKLSVPAVFAKPLGEATEADVLAILVEIGLTGEELVEALEEAREIGMFKDAA